MNDLESDNSVKEKRERTKGMEQSTRAIEVFYAYAHEDKEFSQELEKYLKIWQEEGMVAHWYNRQILVGTDYSQIVDSHINTASLILFLISTDFMASGYSSGIEMKRAIERKRAGEAIVIPIIVRPANWQWAPFSNTQTIPLNGKPLSLYANRDEAFWDIERNVRKAVKMLSHSY